MWSRTERCSNRCVASMSIILAGMAVPRCMPRSARKAGRQAAAASPDSCDATASALAGRRFNPCTTDSRHYLLIAPNLLKQELVASAPNRVWLADITYIQTGEGWLYLAAVLDLATRKVVGLAMRDHMRNRAAAGRFDDGRTAAKTGRRPHL